MPHGSRTNEVVMVGFGLLMVICVGLRFWNIQNSVVFQGDQGRDALIASEIAYGYKLKLIGPVTSVGNMYLGPFYYYFMAVWLFLFRHSPMGPVIGVALVNSIAVVGLYWLAKKMFNAPVAMLAAVIFGTMNTAVTYSRFSWNPNIAAPIALILLSLIYSWWEKPNYIKSIFIGLVYGLLIQTHYVSLTVGVVVFLVWLIKSWQTKALNIWVQGLVILGAWVFTLSPLIIFDLRHDHLLSNQFVNFFNSPEQHIRTSQNLPEILKQFEGRWYLLVAQTITGTKNYPVDKYVGYGLLIAAGLCTHRLFKRNWKVGWIIIVLWMISSVVGTAFYSSTIFLHYVTYSLPIVALLWSLVIVGCWQIPKFGKIISMLQVLSVVFLIYMGIKNYHFDGLGLQRFEDTANYFQNKLNQPYNIALISNDRDYLGMNYRYYFSLNTHPPLPLEDFHSLTQLIVIDETLTTDPQSMTPREFNLVKTGKLREQIKIPSGPQVYLYEKTSEDGVK